MPKLCQAEEYILKSQFVWRLEVLGVPMRHLLLWRWLDPAGPHEPRQCVLILLSEVKIPTCIVEAVAVIQNAEVVGVFKSLAIKLHPLFPLVQRVESKRKSGLGIAFLRLAFSSSP